MVLSCGGSLVSLGGRETCLQSFTSAGQLLETGVDLTVQLRYRFSHLKGYTTNSGLRDVLVTLGLLFHAILPVQKLSEQLTLLLNAIRCLHLNVLHALLEQRQLLIRSILQSLRSRVDFRVQLIDHSFDPCCVSCQAIVDWLQLFIHPYVDLSHLL